jgi:rod shape determining protein RodA
MIAAARPVPVGQKTLAARIDWWMLFAVVALVGIGLMSQYSEGYSRDGLANFRRQVINTGIGLVPFAIFAFISPRFWMRIWPIVYGVMVALLAMTLVAGTTVKGAERWLQIGPIQFQPSEFAKLFLVLTLATFFAKRQHRMTSASTLLLSLLHIGIPVALVLMQPHLGATIVLLATWLAIALLAGTPLRLFAALLGVLVLLGGSLMAVPAVRDRLLHGYQVDRITGYLARDKDRRGDNWQTDRAEIAFGVGGVFGTGFLRGEEKKLGFIPEQRNDFVITVMGEEGGLVGASLVLILYGLLFYRIFLAMLHASEPYYRMIAGGIFAVLGCQTIINLGMVLQLLPVVGLWLPFLSSGGTAIWLCLAFVGLLLNIRARERTVLF